MLKFIARLVARFLVIFFGYRLAKAGDTWEITRYLMALVIWLLLLCRIDRPLLEWLGRGTGIRKR